MPRIREASRELNMRTRSWHCLISSDVLRTCPHTSCRAENPRKAGRNLLRHFPDLSKVFVLRKALDDLVPRALSNGSESKDKAGRVSSSSRTNRVSNSWAVFQGSSNRRPGPAFAGSKDQNTRARGLLLSLLTLEELVMFGVQVPGPFCNFAEVLRLKDWQFAVRNPTGALQALRCP